jgi:hypothetical protein
VNVQAQWVWVVTVAIVAVLVGMSLAGRDAADRRECMSALSTPGVEDPAYDEKAVEFAEGIERCMEQTP